MTLLFNCCYKLPHKLLGRGWFVVTRLEPYPRRFTRYLCNALHLAGRGIGSPAPTFKPDLASSQLLRNSLAEMRWHSLLLSLALMWLCLLTGGEPIPLSHYLWNSTHPLRNTATDQINKNDVLLKSFEEKWVICWRRMYGMKISLVYSLKCHSLTHISYRNWENGRGLVCKTILLVSTFL